MKIQIYTQILSPRLAYVLDFIFKTYYNIEYEIILDKINDIQNKTPLINYSTENIPSAIQIIPDKLLFQTGEIKPQEIAAGMWDDLPVLFYTGSQQALPFDIFSAVFYFLSRYEEYLPFTPDSHGRFPHTESLACKMKISHLPIVDLWCEKLKDIIRPEYPDVTFKKRTFNHISTIDIDNAYAFRHKNIFYQIGASVNDFFTGNFSNQADRIHTIFRIKQDPYDSYNHIKSIHKKHNKNAIYFFLLRHSGKYDKSLSVKNSHFKNLIKKINSKSETGIHPSYTSDSNYEPLAEEIKLLQNITNLPVSKSRQHFIKLNFPKTYQNLYSLGIKEDYSMGWPSIPGFRAGTSTPFLFYDLLNEKNVDLMIYPFQIMDSTLKYNMNKNPEEALESITEIIDSIKKVNGTFISVWHNESLGTSKKWCGWDSVFEKMMYYCSL